MKSSLSLRLLIAAAISTLIALLATALLLNHFFRGYFEERVHDELEAWLIALTSQTELNEDGRLVVSELDDPRFRQPLSGYYWQAVTEGSVPVLSASLWAEPLDVPRPKERGTIEFASITGSDDAIYRTGTWLITLMQGSGDVEILLTIAVDEAIVENPISQFSRNVSLAMAVLGAFLVLASWFQVRVGLRPLNKVTSEVNAVKSDPSRRLSNDYAIEVAPLVDEVNALLEDQEQSIRNARTRASTLAHGLKTPLTVMRALAQDLRHEDETTISAEIDAQIDDMQHLVERELARTRDQQTRVAASCEVAPVVARVVKAFQRRVGNAKTKWVIEVSSETRCPFDSFALTELLGNLIDNATKWTKDEIRISAAGSKNDGYLEIADNGPGIPEDKFEIAMQQGQRLDDTVPGHGLGLAIIQDMVAKRDAKLTLDHATSGGLLVRIDWGEPAHTITLKT
ncbi:Signal transduction histidine kinase [Cognatiyoonia koreensis]|uniref:histidine kinase n=1 Tax=Cognatiyoonia koreensis TaxID=364200 RepID=A0A1I0PBM4_9RHOB|nr:HAMP domain-containing sensor histidine kinase [Cognatiyoonia koreensis]SEW11521.1 Signal transduction histidine kinase [Cognatiyoonia koreensis]